MKIISLITLVLSSMFGISQVSNSQGLFAREYSKEITIPLAKEYLVTEVLKPTGDEVLVFEIDALTAATSGELTCVMYNCSTKNMNGLIFAFYGNEVAESGMSYKAYSFKHFTKAQGIELFQKIDNLITSNTTSDLIEKNITFKYEDVTFIIYRSLETKIDIVWNGFNAQWDHSTLKTTLRKLEKK